MKKTNLYILLAVGTLGVAAFSPKLIAAADGAMPSCCGAVVPAMPSCCAGATQPMADAAAAKPDLLTTCPVTGEKLGEMGKPVVFTYKDQEVKLCCKGCKKDFDKDPEKYMALIRAADKK